MGILLQNRWKNFHFSWFLPTFGIYKIRRCMENKVFFMESIQDYDLRRHPQCVIHILCTRGSMSFHFQHIHYNIVAGDYVILTNMSLDSGFSGSDESRALTIAMSDSVVSSMALS